MSGAIWIVRRYQLPKYNKKSLTSEIKSWVKQRQGRIQHSHYSHLFGKYSATYYQLASPGALPLWLGGQTTNLFTRYEALVLFVYVNKKTFPKMFQDIHESVIMPYVKQYGGTLLDETPYMLDMDLRPWFDRHFRDQGVHDTFIQALKLKEEGNVDASPLLGSPSQTGPKVAAIHLDAEIQTVQTASEEVSVPPGVTIKVKRSRTIEHTVDIDWHISGGISIDSGFKPIISASIRGEIGQRQGRTYHESETLEYEVALSGESSTRYRLTWTDVWRKGVAKFQIGHVIQTLPFRFREWTELEVFAMDRQAGVSQKVSPIET